MRALLKREMGKTHFCLRKLDIEGSEFLALRNSAGAPPFMLVEVHITEGARVLNIAKDRGKVWDAFVNIAGDAGYTVLHERSLGHRWQDPVVMLGRSLRGPDKTCENCLRRLAACEGTL